MIAKITPLLKLPSKIDCFDYFVSPQLRGQIQPGSLVKIPWRASYCEGVVLQIISGGEPTSFRPRPIHSLLLREPALTSEQLLFLKNFSAYYFVSWGYAARLALAAPPKRQPALPAPEIIPRALSFPIVKSELPKLEKFFAAFRQRLPVNILASDVASAVWLAQKIIAREREAIFLFLPTREWVNIFTPIFKKNFGARLAVYHGGLSKSEGWRNYLAILNRKTKLIISTRLGIFLPRRREDRVIFFDAAAEEFKQTEQHPRYDARIMARENAVLLSSSPSIDSPESVLALPSASGQKTKLQIIDLQNRANRSGAAPWLSEKILVETQENCLHKQKTVFICLRETAKDEFLLNVDKVYSLLTKIIKNGIIVKYSEPFPLNIEFDVMVTTPVALERLKLAFWRGEIRTMVICSIEPLLGLPDYRKTERAYVRVRRWLMIAQECRTANVYLQAFHPDNPAIAALQKNNPAEFWQEEMAGRKKFVYPPFSDLIKIIYKGNDKNALANLKKELERFAERDLILRGPYQSRDWGKKEWPTLLLKVKNKNLDLPLSALGPDWLIDRDPENVL